MVFTPPDLARRLVEPLGAATPLLDPACGDGALLAAGFEAALGAGQGLRAALERLEGIERRPGLARAARDRLRALAPVAGEPRVRTADALAIPWPSATWVVANPPFGSLSGRASRGIAPSERRRFADRSGPGGWPSLHGAFLLRIARHVARERTGARVIAPAAVLTGRGYGPLREALAELVEPAEAPKDLGEGAFPGVVLPTAIVTWVHRGAAGGSIGGSSGGEPTCTGRPAIAGPDRPGPDLETALRAHLASRPRLPPKTFADPGLHSGNAARELVVRGGSSPPSPAHAPLREGRSLAAFDLGPPGAWVRTDLEPTPERRFRLRSPSHYAAFAVLVRQTAPRPIAALHEPPARFRNSLLAARPVDGLDPAFVVAVLNSPVAAAWYRASFADARQRTFPQVKVGHLDRLPFPIAQRGDDPRLHDELAARVRALEPGSAGFERAVGAIAERVAQAFDLPPALRDAVRSNPG